MFDLQGYYAALGLSEEQSRVATAADVKSAYVAAAKRLHPDTVASTEEERARGGRQRAAADRFLKVQRAYEVLRDTDKRRMYDAGSAVPADP